MFCQFSVQNTFGVVVYGQDMHNATAMCLIIFYEIYSFHGNQKVFIVFEKATTYDLLSTNKKQLVICT